MAKFKIREVIREFKNEKNVPKLELSCGHVCTDPDFWYGNERGYLIGRIAQKISGEARKTRCYKCGEQI